jgi:hypothetical protein
MRDEHTSQCRAVEEEHWLAGPNDNELYQCILCQINNAEGEDDLPHEEADPLAFKLVSCPSSCHSNSTHSRTFKRSNNAVPCQQQQSAPRKLENPSAMNLKYVLTIFIML